LEGHHHPNRASRSRIADFSHPKKILKCLAKVPLRPFGITGTLGLSIPTRAVNESIVIDPVTGQKTVSVDHNPNTLKWGLAQLPHFSDDFLI